MMPNWHEQWSWQLGHAIVSLSTETCNYSAVITRLTFVRCPFLQIYLYIRRVSFPSNIHGERKKTNLYKKREINTKNVNYFIPHLTIFYNYALYQLKTDVTVTSFVIRIRYKMAFSEEDRIVIQYLRQNQNYSAKRFLREFPDKTS